MKLGSFEARFPFGLLVIADPASKDAHDTWNPSSERVHAGPDSLYVGVRDAASGLVSVTCIEDADTETISRYRTLFHGQLELTDSRLKFYDPDESISMIMPVSGNHIQVRIYADNPREPSELVVHVMCSSNPLPIVGARYAFGEGHPVSNIEQDGP